MDVGGAGHAERRGQRADHPAGRHSLRRFARPERMEVEPELDDRPTRGEGPLARPLVIPDNGSAQVAIRRRAVRARRVPAAVAAPSGRLAARAGTATTADPAVATRSTLG